MEEAKRCQKKKQSTISLSRRNVDPHHFNRNPESDEKSITKKKSWTWWWKKNPLLQKLFFSGKRRRSVPEDKYTGVDRGGFHHYRVPDGLSKSDPAAAVYATESRSGSLTPYRNNYSPIAGSMSPAHFPYVNVDQQQQHCSRMSTSSMPIYLVT